MKAADWKRFLFGPFEYFLAEFFEEPVAGTLQALFSVIQKVLLITINTDSDHRNAIRVNKKKSNDLKTEVVLALSLMERDLPITMMCYVVHSLVHVPAHIFRWNHVRNCWAFFNERFVGWITRFIKNRHNACANLVNGYGRMTLTRRVDPKIRQLILQRWSELGVSKLGLQLLETTQQKLARKPCLPGSEIVHVSCHWRNSRTAGESVPGLQDFLDESAGAGDNIVLDNPPSLRIMSKGVAFNGRKWYAGDYGLFRKTDRSLWLGRVEHFLFVPQRTLDSYIILALVHTFECQGKAKNFNFVYCVKLKCVSSHYIRMQDFCTMAVVAPHWTDSTLACALVVDPVMIQL